MNETEVPEYPITDWIPTHATVEMQRYPQPGDPNPEVRVGVVGASGGKTVWVKLPIQRRPGLHSALRLGRSQNAVDRDADPRSQASRLYFADASNGAGASGARNTDDKFLDDNYDVSVGDGTIVLTNWTDGHNHLYLYSYDQADPGCRHGQAGAATDQGRF